MGKKSRNRRNKVKYTIPKGSTNDFHEVPKCRGGSSSNHNVHRELVVVHEAYHKVFGVKTPAEAVHQLVTQYAVNSTTDEFKNEVERILRKGKKFIYKRGVFRSKDYYLDKYDYKVKYIYTEEEQNEN